VELFLVLLQMLEFHFKHNLFDVMQTGLMWSKTQCFPRKRAALVTAFSCAVVRNLNISW